MKTERHTLSLHDRGLEHCHRWMPKCSCGWVGVQRRRVKEAVKQHRGHVSGIVNAGRRGSAKPRRLTPVDRLPAALR